MARVCTYLPDQIVSWIERKTGLSRGAALRRYILEKLASESDERIQVLAKAELVKEEEVVRNG